MNEGNERKPANGKINKGKGKNPRTVKMNEGKGRKILGSACYRAVGLTMSGS
jgi:hypothetical protein